MKHTYKFEWDEASDISVVIEVDTNVLSAETAHEINNFITNNSGRFFECDENIHLVVARLFASYFMQWALGDGGASCNKGDKRGPEFVRRVLDWVGEGWPDAKDCGLSIVSAYVPVPGFDSLTTMRMQS